MSWTRSDASSHSAMLSSSSSDIGAVCIELRPTALTTPENETDWASIAQQQPNQDLQQLEQQSSGDATELEVLQFPSSNSSANSNAADRLKAAGAGAGAEPTAATESADRKQPTIKAKQVPPRVLALATPRVRRMLKLRTRIRFVSFVLFAVLGKTLLLSLVLPFWGETSISQTRNVTAAPPTPSTPGTFNVHVDVSDKNVGLLFEYSDFGHRATFPQWPFGLSAFLMCVSIVLLMATGLVLEHCRRCILEGQRVLGYHTAAAILPLFQILAQLGAFYIFGRYGMPREMDDGTANYQWDSTVWGGSIYELFVIMAMEGLQCITHLNLRLVVGQIPGEVLKYEDELDSKEKAEEGEADDSGDRLSAPRSTSALMAESMREDASRSSTEQDAWPSHV
ncbi:hypothetical protein CAOG_09114 [Capsaspora owczarzaki ATCC 30864]|uniref:Transmembrane protein n=1 Tax=Capsaspora owczarzaki (strain ATCC 30864) TaxID=595528 RepID=A0A0D2WX10_CAPO3|nr:hypothetical protein CAOG_09114 [Capsaspora owczarzaki ATCC 30864]KJE97238.1 hypothetical protein CAOG_009114 [Capsaspora owczarzaki ATCC 30864]|eukprot:XP_011270771.1 hypothetical protein CAOG_09114 [Capsaspora owczarzaki ATCC 30864]